jgi:tetratricopeptide (TPR) repeat protein
MRSLLVLVALLLAARAAHADDAAIAEAEFVKAKRLMKEGKTADACLAFERSQKLDPQNGTRYNLAICYAELGKTATAFAIFRELAQKDQNAARKADSAKRAEKLEPRLMKLLVVARSHAPGLVVERDGVDVTRLLGIEEPIDPGRYRITARADGKAPWEQEVEVTAAEGGVIIVEIPALKRPDEVGGPDQDKPIEEEEEAPRRREQGSSGRGRRFAGLAFGTGGVIAAGVGLLYGSRARSTWDEVQFLCGEDLVCTTAPQFQDAMALVEDARAAGNKATWLVGAGAVAIGVGVYLYVTAPKGVKVAPRVDGDAVGLVARGAF